ncbi:MAG: hypothetical protein HZA83_03515 [Thaumarchaeota archaeon]|nr:hypothetical protein [Nitrososphaerota archaeon]
MCKLCDSVKNNSKYSTVINKMFEADKARLDFSKLLTSNLQPMANALYTSIEWPVKFMLPMFEARTAYCVPNNYFQSLFLDGERCGAMFSHGSMRSVFFVDNKLILFSKTVGHAEGREFFTSFVLADFAPGEFKYHFDGDNFAIMADAEKKMKNLVTGKTENKKISFNFVNQSVKNRIVDRDKVLTSSQFRTVYEKYGGALNRTASIDLEGYAITVPHLAPHPYMLQLHKELGFESNREMQEHAIDYFRAHLGI